MIDHYLKTALRSLSKNKTYSIINIAGSAIGIAAFILVMLYVNYELSYDKFFVNSENIYRVYMEYSKGNHFEPGDAQTYNLSGPTLKKEFTEITDFVRLYRLGKSVFEYENKVFDIPNGHLADPSYFNVFKCPLVSGNSATALNEPNTIVLTQNIADKIFGKTNPVGKTIDVYCDNKKTTLTITGILRDIPENTHMKTDFLVSFQTINTWHVSSPSEPNWNNNNYYTYILVDKKIDIQNLKEKITKMNFPNNLDQRHTIEPLTSIHLNSDKPYEAEANGSAVRVKLLFVIALIIIVLSWLNYMNLTTAKSLERSKEVGVRKVSGARKLQLIFQFMSESVLLNSVAIIFALGLVILILPYFNLLTGKHLLLGLSWSSPFFLLTGIPLVGIILSGLYPAFVLSGFKPSIILKGKPSISFKNLNFRKSFVVVQFLITIVLLIGSLTIMKQMHFLSNQPLGFSQHNILSIKGEFIDDNENYMNSLKTLKGEIQKLSFVEGVASAGTYPGEGYDNLNSFMGVVYPDGTLDDRTVWYNFRVDEDFFSLLHIEILAGKAFENNGDINRNKVIINEKAAIKMGLTNFKEAINQKIKFGGRDCYIIGIMKNHHHFGLKNEVEPFIMTYSGISNGLLVKLNEKATSLAGIGSAIKQLKEQWKHLFPKSTFQYVFINDTLNMLYAEERMFSKAFTIFTILAIIIASLGLFGLAFYRSLLRTKEIGIRKVNGARVTEILSMLNNDYLIWVTVAFILACPIAWYAMNKWLQNFAYKTEMSWWIFALAGLLSLMVALATVSWQSYRAATRNPVESLKDE